jgi:hypothetical protein
MAVTFYVSVLQPLPICGSAPSGAAHAFLTFLALVGVCRPFSGPRV